jgi:hypothetical protein
VAAGEQITIHSYRAVFDLERRIYRIDTLRLNPAGVPLRGILYAAVLALLALVVCRLGALGWPLRALPWYVRLVLAPALGSPAGRSSPEARSAQLRRRLGGQGAHRPGGDRGWRRRAPFGR